MLRKSTYILTLVLIFIAGTSYVLSSFRPPQGSTGATAGVTCGNNGVGCHTSFAANSGGGTVTVTGLPGVYIPGVSYNFSITITHGTGDRTRWGFSILGVNGVTPIGTFSSTNPDASPNGAELSHGSLSVPSFAPFTTPQASYTFNNLTWTAPSTNQGRVTFYFAGVAGDNINSSAGDYVYTNSTLSAPLPISLSAFNAALENSNVLLSWKTAQETNSDYFTIQKSYDNKQFNDIGKVSAAGNSSLARSYTFRDNNLSFFEKPTYYRLAMVDKDGVKSYSKIANVVLKATATFIKSIYPNPLRGGSMLHVDFVSKESQTLYVKLIDNAGRLIKTIEVAAAKGSNILNLTMPRVSPGNYEVVIKTNDGFIREAIMVH